MSNRLKKEISPYLQQHKDNPVDWFPWCDEAFTKAEKENKAIFISIGYSSCHWCNVMDEKIFENQECANILNKDFVCIKVDREERPDIDKYYQKVYSLIINRSAGWPTSIFSTPQNKPFFAGTYIAPQSEIGSIEGMGFIELTKLIAKKVEDEDPTLTQNADEIEVFLQKATSHPKEATVLKEDFVKNFMHQVKNNYETRYGGFSVAPKFPHANTLNALINIDKLYNDKAAKAMVTDTLNSMIVGGFYDKVDGGFYRYSIDEMWSKPSADKTLYDNALLCEVFINAYLAYDDENYLKVAKSCAKYLSNQKLKLPFTNMVANSLFRLSEVDESYKQKAIKSIDEKNICFLDDYASLSQALLSAYNSTKDELYLINAQKTINKALERFYKNGVWNFSDGDFIVKADTADNTYTSPVSIMIDALLSLGTLLEDKKYTHFAYKTLEYNSYELGRKPVYFPYMLTQMLRYLKIKNSF
ncbi:MAG: thioredoxin domain-containing protein [Sulfurimonas sp.]|nr:thioredoxin domain-containing protein [Sulfurimonas sp.]